MDKWAGVSDAAVRKATGRDWAAWIAALDRAGANRLPHRDIAAFVHARLGVDSGWWSQMVTVGYEQAKGLRDVHQTTDGYVANASKTIAASADAVYRAWSESRRRTRWLGDAFTITTSTPARSLRIAWPDGTRVDVNLYPKGDAKTQVAVQHAKLASAVAVGARKAYWKEALERLEATLAR